MQNSQTQARLLIVEDSIVQAKMLQRILVEKGYAVDIARNGADGWAKVKALRPNLVISDIIMPEMSGFELCRQIRAEESLKDLPFILVTVLFELEDVLEGLASGADNFITKPYSESRLLSIVRELLARRKLSGKDQGKNGLLVIYGGQKYCIREAPKRILDFFLSTYGIALEKNVELIQTQRELQELNEQLEKRVQERTMALIAEFSQRQKAEEELARTRLHQEQILNSVGNGIMGLDHQGLITFANPAATSMLDYTQEEVIGQSIEALCRFTKSDSNPFPEEEYPVRATLQDGKVRRIDGIFCRHDGTSFPAESTSTAIREGGRITGAVFTFRDIIERKRTEQALRKAFEGAVKALSQTVEARDPYTAGHQLRTTVLACAIAREMGLSEDRIDVLRIAGALHDIGKIQIPAEILSKPTRLTEYEFNLVKIHPQVGYDIVCAVEFPGKVADILVQHHERIDGSGYPAGIVGQEIILEGRILAVADVVEAMASHRPYRPALGIDKALVEISQNRGIIFDPDVVDACVRLFTEKGFSFTN